MDCVIAKQAIPRAIMLKNLGHLKLAKATDKNRKAKNVAGYRNYDSSEFARTSALLDDDEAMEAVWKRQYPLAELVAEDQFKTYDELKTRLDYVLGIKGTPKMQDQESIQEEEEFRQANRGTGTSSTGGFNDPDITLSSSTKTDDDDECQMN